MSHYYRPYRARIEEHIAQKIASGERVIHVSAHSFTRILDGCARTTDIGLLYDPSRSFETRVCCAWQERLTATAPGLRVRRNYPYRGTADGFTSYLRTRFPNKRYAGIELEVSQGFPLASAREGRLGSKSMPAAGGVPAVRYSPTPWLRLLRGVGVGPRPDNIYRMAPRSSSEYSASCDTMNW